MLGANDMKAFPKWVARFKLTSPSASWAAMPIKELPKMMVITTSSIASHLPAMSGQFRVRVESISSVIFAALSRQMISPEKKIERIKSGKNVPAKANTDMSVLVGRDGSGVTKSRIRINKTDKTKISAVKIIKAIERIVVRYSKRTRVSRVRNPPLLIGFANVCSSISSCAAWDRAAPPVFLFDRVTIPRVKRRKQKAKSASPIPPQTSRLIST